MELHEITLIQLQAVLMLTLVTRSIYMYLNRVVAVNIDCVFQSKVDGQSMGDPVCIGKNIVNI